MPNKKSKRGDRLVRSIEQLEVQVAERLIEQLRKAVLLELARRRVKRS